MCSHPVFPWMAHHCPKPGFDCISCLPHRQLCVPNSMCFNWNSWHLLAVGFHSRNHQIQQADPTISHWHSLLSAGCNSVCLLYGCRRLHLHISFVFWQRLMCFDAVLSVMWIWMGCVQRLACQGENDPDWQRDDLSLSPTIPFQVSPWIAHTHTHTHLPVPLAWVTGLGDGHCILIRSPQVLWPQCWSADLSLPQTISVFPSLKTWTRMRPEQDRTVYIFRNKCIQFVVPGGIFNSGPTIQPN